MKPPPGGHLPVHVTTHEGVALLVAFAAVCVLARLRRGRPAPSAEQGPGGLGLVVLAVVAVAALGAGARHVPAAIKAATGRAAHVVHANTAAPAVRHAARVATGHPWLTGTDAVIIAVVVIVVGGGVAINSIFFNRRSGS